MATELLEKLTLLISRQYGVEDDCDISSSHHKDQTSTNAGGDCNDDLSECNNFKNGKCDVAIIRHSKCHNSQLMASLNAGNLAPYEFEWEAFDMIFQILIQNGFDARFSYLFSQHFINHNLDSLQKSLADINSYEAAIIQPPEPNDELTRSAEKNGTNTLQQPTLLVDSKHFYSTVIDLFKKFCKEKIGQAYCESLLKDLQTKKHYCQSQDGDGGGEKSLHAYRLLQYSVYASRNGRRKMEDRHVVAPDMRLIFGAKIKDFFKRSAYFAVFDGHGGKECSNYAATHLLSHIICCLPTKDLNLEDHAAICTSIKDGFLNCDRYLQFKCQHENLKSGTTAACVLVFDNVVYLAWLGDSQVLILDDSNKCSFITPTHDTKNESECAKIVENGGIIFNILGANRVNGVINVTRSLGDQFLKPPLTAVPDVKVWPLTDRDRFFIIGSDGLWDGLSVDYCAELIEEYNKENADMQSLAKFLVEKAQSNGVADNITAIVLSVK